MKKILIVMALFVLPLSAFGVKVSSLYVAELPVASQSAEARAPVVKDGFVQVLTRLTGDPQIINNPEIQPLLDRADYYVADFSYSLPSPAAYQYFIRIHYDEADVNRLLKRSGITFWGENRPLILVWLTVSNREHGAEVVDNESAEEIFATMKQQAKRFGLPLIFPIMDMADISEVSPDDISTMDLPVLKEAGKRYSPDAMLIGKLMTVNGGYQGQWQLILDNNQWRWLITDKSSETVITDVLNQVSQTLAKHYVVKLSDAPEILINLQVSNITQEDDLTRLMKYLKQLAPVVEDVELSQVSGDVVNLSVEVRGTLALFKKNAAIGKHLLLKTADTEKNILVYEWVH